MPTGQRGGTVERLLLLSGHKANRDHEAAWLLSTIALISAFVGVRLKDKKCSRSSRLHISLTDDWKARPVAHRATRPNGTPLGNLIWKQLLETLNVQYCTALVFNWLPRQLKPYYKVREETRSKEVSVVISEAVGNDELVHFRDSLHTSHIEKMFFLNLLHFIFSGGCTK